MRGLKRITSVAATMCVAAAVLAGCGGSDTGQATSTGLTAEGMPDGLPEPSQEQLEAWKDVEGTVYVLTPGVTSARWNQFEMPLWTEALKTLAPNATLKQLDGADSETQQSAMESAIAAGADGIIFVAVLGATNTTALLKSAADADIPVIGYAHDISDAPYDPETGEGAPNYQVTVNLAKEYFVPSCEALAADAEKSDKTIRVAYMGLGRESPAIARYDEGCMSALKPGIEAGTLELACEEHVTSFDASEHQKMMEQCLTRTNNEIDVVVSHNDDVVGGAIAALKEEDLQGKVKVYGGYDATLEGVQRVLAGWQEFDIVPPYAQQAWMSIELILSEIADTDPPEGYPNQNYWDGNVVPTSEPGIPAAILDNFHVFTDEDIQRDVIDANIYTKEQVCDPSGVAVDTDFCTSS